jgi:hypothetical protein
VGGVAAALCAVALAELAGGFVAFFAGHGFMQLRWFYFLAPDVRFHKATKFLFKACFCLFPKGF